MKNKIPAMQFYTGDWLKAPDVRALSPAARGVWFDLLCFMWESEDRGKLVTNGRALTDEELARMTGLDVSTAQQILSTIRNTGVSGVDQKTGAMMCRRMVRYEEIRRMKSRAGSSKRQQNANRTPIKTQQRGGPSGCCPSGTGPSGTESSDSPPSPPTSPAVQNPDPNRVGQAAGRDLLETPRVSLPSGSGHQETAFRLARIYDAIVGGPTELCKVRIEFAAALRRVSPQKLEASLHAPVCQGQHAWKIVHHAEFGKLPGPGTGTRKGPIDVDDALFDKPGKTPEKGKRP